MLFFAVTENSFFLLIGVGVLQEKKQIVHLEDEEKDEKD